MTMNARHFTARPDTATVAPGDYSIEYQAVYNAMTNKPTSTIAAHQDTLCRDLVADGLWAEADAILVFAQYSNSAGEALLQWKNPTGTSASNTNAPTFTSLEGFLYNGSSSYTNTLWNPTDDGSNWLQNDAAFGMYSRTAGQSAGSSGASDGTTWNTQSPRWTDDNAYISVNGGSFVSTASLSGAGFFLISRTAAGSVDYYVNGNGGTNLGYISTGIGTRDFLIGAFDNNSTIEEYTARQISFVYVGGGLTAQESTDLNTAIEKYMDAIGSGVQ